jgi:hypothetical protein
MSAAADGAAAQDRIIRRRKHESEGCTTWRLCFPDKAGARPGGGYRRANAVPPACHGPARPRSGRTRRRICGPVEGEPMRRQATGCFDGTAQSRTGRRRYGSSRPARESTPCRLHIATGPAVRNRAVGRRRAVLDYRQEQDGERRAGRFAMDLGADGAMSAAMLVKRPDDAAAGRCPAASIPPRQLARHTSPEVRRGVGGGFPARAHQDRRGDLLAQLLAAPRQPYA